MADAFSAVTAGTRVIGEQEAAFSHQVCGYQRTSTVAEREGFEPPIRLPVCRISSAVQSTTLPPLRLGPLAQAVVIPIWLLRRALATSKRGDKCPREYRLRSHPRAVETRDFRCTTAQ